MSVHLYKTTRRHVPRDSKRLTRIRIPDIQSVADCLTWIVIITEGYANVVIKERNFVARSIHLYRVSQEECEILRESVPYVKLYRYNPKHLYPKLKGYGVNGHRKVWAAVVSTNCTPSVTQYSSCSDLDERFLTR